MKEDLNKAKLDATRKANLLASLKKDRDALHAANQALLKQKDLLEKKLERALNDSKAKVLPLLRPLVLLGRRRRRFSAGPRPAAETQP